MPQARGFGTIRTLPSGRVQAFYRRDGMQHVAPITFDAKIDAEAWLTDERRLIAAGTWTPPALRRATASTAPITFRGYALAWLAQRDLKPRTREHYRQLLDDHLLPRFGGQPLRAIGPADVRTWWAAVAIGRPAARAHAYGLLRTIMATAVADDAIPANPCRVRGAGTVKRARTIRPASIDELRAIADGMPDRLRLMVQLAGWCGLRFGELAELRRSDIDTKAGVIRVCRGLSRIKGGTVVGTPKSEAGIRDVTVPPHILPDVRDHLQRFTAWGRDGLLFPATHGGQLAPTTVQRWFYKAREKANRPDLAFHDLRHTQAVLAALTGATLAELMGRLGHSTPAAAMRYQHIADGRDAEIAARLSELAKAAK